MIVLLLVTGIANYINYYNNERYQWNLKNLTPVEYQNQAT
ncbi:IS3 family transposase [Ligilactobacillus salivarius]